MRKYLLNEIHQQCIALAVDDDGDDDNGIEMISLSIAFI